VDVSWDRTTAHVGLAGWRADGLLHVEVIASRSGTDWVADWLTDDARSEAVRRACVAGVVVQVRSPAASLIDPLRDVGVEIAEWSGDELGRGTGAFYDRVRSAVGEGTGEGGLRHLGQPVLDVAAANAATKPTGDAWLFDRKKSPADCSPLITCVGAAWALGQAEESPPDIW
jgi:hypothetical protein